jgi:hypothetical protein
MEVSMDDFMKDYNEWLKTRKNHHLEIEISITWDDEDEYEHEGYYHTIDDAIEALIDLKKIEKDLQEVIIK